MRLIVSFALILMLAACASAPETSHRAPGKSKSGSEGKFKVGNPYRVEGKLYTPKEDYRLVETGIASWYGPQFHGKSTANGEKFDMNELTAAHRTLQMPSLVRVTNLDNGRAVIVRINDRGPYKRGRVIDVSKKAAQLLGFINTGTARVKLEVLEKESRSVADAARRGIDTRGTEVAMNSRGVTGLPDYGAPPASVSPGRQPVMERVSASAVSTTGRVDANGMFIPGNFESATIRPVEQEILSEASQGNIPLHVSDGRLMPDPVVTHLPVTPVNIYIQAGSFSMQDNAYRLAQSLGSYGNTKVVPALVNGRDFYRVRLGPYATVEQADAALARVAGGGQKQAIIVVE